MALVKLTVHW